jgi:fatty-acyl-CoA synthase
MSSFDPLEDGGHDELGFVALTPTAFLVRSATVFADRLAVVDGPCRWTYRDLFDRSRRLAGGLRALGVRSGHRVAVLAPNSALLVEAHHGVPFAGAVLVALNTRLAPPELGYILGHAEADVLLVDESLNDVAAAAASASGRDVRIVVAGSGGPGDEYEELLDAEPLVEPVDDERALLALNYTSGTTGHPKGVRYHHRGAYLQSLAMAFHSRLGPESVFLWTLPMFHCNGWCFTWAVTAAGGVHRCLRSLDPGEVWRAIREEGVTHLDAAPTVLTMLAADPAAAAAPHPVAVATGGAPPSPTLLDRMASLNLQITHLYGLTETFGPSVICEPQPEWRQLSADERARLQARQGVPNILGGGLRVVDADGRDVPADGVTLGQIALRGNNVMAGYHLDPVATAAAITSREWFLTGDLGVLHADGYVELKDRAKDIVITGGENVSTVEVEQALCSHPAVSEAAVVGSPHELWGEVPVAFVALRPEAMVAAEELQEHVRARLAGFKVPKQIRFGELPKTSTGKIQKYLLRAGLSHEGDEGR